MGTMQEIPLRRSFTWLPLCAACSKPKRSKARMISRPDRGGSLGMLVDRDRGHQRRAGELHRLLREEHLDGVAQIGECLVDRLPLSGRARLGVEGNIPPLFGWRENS